MRVYVLLFGKDGPWGVYDSLEAAMHEAEDIAEIDVKVDDAEWTHAQRTTNTYDDSWILTIPEGSELEAVMMIEAHNLKSVSRP